MTKKEIFDYLNSGDDKSGNLKKEGGFKKHFPEEYEEFSKVIFPDEIKELPFKQRLWHFLKDVYEIPVCKICQSPVSFLTRAGQWGYSIYCSGSCAMKDDIIKDKLNTTKENRYGSKTYNNSKKQIETIMSKGEEYWKSHQEKSLKTRYEKNNGKYFSNESIQKIKDTTKKRYGVDSFTKTKEFCDIIKEKHNDIQKKQYQTKTKNHSFNTSKIENLFEKFFQNISIDYIRQYKSEIYPYSCDFYIPGLDLYIEIQASWTHGNNPFNESSKEDMDKLSYWRSRDNEYYNNAIYTWTDLDVRKRQTAKTNELNYLEIFSNDIDECKSIFKDYIKNLLVDWCMKSDFPGTVKWPANHPIWDCNVGNRMSPKSAWKNERYIRRAVDNMFDMMERYDDFKVKHMNEIMKCIIRNNEIVSSTPELLTYILNRFTIAKIAPKVTALSEKTMRKMIDVSGIDISCGVYVPMAGFGGIVRAAEDWGKDHNKDIEVEAYDINPNFCNWYGWVQRDMLNQKVKTDKVCLCCPPFGKRYEHWSGTPDEMSDKDFKEWYRLIKEYVDAPAYIIIGPELGGKENVNGLFKKTVGVMVYTDEMMK